VTAVDEGALRALVDDLGGDTEAVKELVQSFLEEAPRLVAQAREAAGRGDAAGVQRAFHTLKGMAATFGALALSGHAREAEQAARAGRLPTQADLDRAESLLAAVRKELLARLG
jgi:histidine phosphotransfer protein HptB